MHKLSTTASSENLSHILFLSNIITKSISVQPQKPGNSNTYYAKYRLFLNLNYMIVHS